jgi:hypothetical protein
MDCQYIESNNEERYPYIGLMGINTPVLRLSQGTAINMNGKEFKLATNHSGVSRAPVDSKFIITVVAGKKKDYLVVRSHNELFLLTPGFMIGIHQDSAAGLSTAYGQHKQFIKIPMEYPPVGTKSIITFIQHGHGNCRVKYEEKEGDFLPFSGTDYFIDRHPEGVLIQDDMDGSKFVLIPNQDYEDLAKLFVRLNEELAVSDPETKDDN